MVRHRGQRPGYSYYTPQIKKLQSENKMLWGILVRINKEIKHEYGHSDSGRYNRVLLNWNRIIGKALKSKS